MAFSTTYKDLKKRFQAFHYEEPEFTYEDVYSRAILPELKPRKAIIQRQLQFRLPSRLASPLVLVPKEIQLYCESNFPEEFTGLNQLTLNSLYTLGEGIKNEFPVDIIKNYKVSTDIVSLLSYSTQLNDELLLLTSPTSKAIGLSVSKLINWLTVLDLKGLMMKDKLDYDIILPALQESRLVQFILIVRAVATRIFANNKSGINSAIVEEFGIKVKVNEMNQIIVYTGGSETLPCMFLSDRFACMLDKTHKKLIITPMAYVDYMFTRAEIMLNLDIIKATREHSDMDELFDFLKRYTLQSNKHELIVEFMKSYEGFLNMTADFKADSRSSIGSYKSTIESMIKLDKLITGTETSIDEVLKVLFGDEGEWRSVSQYKVKYSILLLLSNSIRNLSPTQLLEASSLHKLCFYAIVDESKGMRKYLARTHTKRECDPDSIMKMRSYFNREYIISYTEKHNRLPNLMLKQEDAIRSDINPILKSTDVSDIQLKIDSLLFDLNAKGGLNRESKPLDWWYDLRPYNTESIMEAGTPIEQAKDKRSAKVKGDYSLTDSEKELEYIIKTDDIKYLELIESDLISPRMKSFRIIQQNSELYDEIMTAIAKLKEREQKGEGRLFAMFTTEGKQTISKFMRKAEHILSYFKGNLMTPSDKQRKTMLHWVAQSLLDEDKYALLADIEGHNQSMQFDNTSDLLESIGLCYGEASWYKLSNLFPSLNFFYSSVFSDYSYISNGQLGGIEGWFNPVWTLHTLIITKLIPEMTNISSGSEMVYSDDIAISISIDIYEDETLNRVMNTIQNHFSKFGMLLKALQTVVSKTRVTMLRQHYSNGVRSDSSLKRMVATSAMGNSAFHSDEFECSGISSAISSSLELSNTIMTQTYLKWTRVASLLIRPFISQISTMIDIDLLESGAFKERTISLYKSMYPYNDKNDLVGIRSNLKWILSNPNISDLQSALNQIFNKQSKVKLSDDQLANFKSGIIHCLAEDEGLYVLFLIKCVAPEDLGGCSVLFLENMVLTGFRDSVARNYSILKKYLSSEKKLSSLLNLALEYALGGNGKCSDLSVEVANNRQNYREILKNGRRQFFKVEYDETSLITQEWPNAQRTQTLHETIKRGLSKYFRSICVNKGLKSMLECEEKRHEYKVGLMKQLKESFYGKIANFYMDVSIFMVIDKVLGKVENTSSLIRKVPNFKIICREASNSGMVAYRKWLTKPLFTFGEINYETIMQEYLFARRKEMFPDVIFLETIEPEPNSLLLEEPTNNMERFNNDWFLHCVTSSGQVHVGSKLRYLPPTYGSEALYKGSLRDPTDHFNHIREALLIKNISITKWILYRSNPNQYFERINEDSNIKNCSNMALRTLGYSDFDNYRDFVSLTARSEIAHRIPVLDAKVNAAVRALPMYIIRFVCDYNQKMIDSRDLADSNLHFDLFKLRVTAASAAALSLRQVPSFNKRWILKPSYLVRDVRFDYYKQKPRIGIKDFYYSNIGIDYKVDSTRIRWLSENLEHILKGEVGTSIPLNAEFNNVPTNAEDLIAIEIVLYYKELKQQLLWDRNPFWNKQAWLPFISAHKEAFTDDLDSNINYITDVLKKEFDNRVRTYKNAHSISEDILIKTVICKRFKTNNNLLEQEWLSLKDKVCRLMQIASSRSEGGIISDAEIDLIMSEVTKSSNNALKLLLEEIIVDNCIIIRKVNGHYKLERNQSRFLMEKFVMDFTSFNKLSRQDIIMINFTLRKIHDDALFRIFEDILNELEEIIEELGIEVEVEETVNMKNKYDDVNLGVSKHFHGATELYTNLYNITDIGSTIVKKLPKILNLRIEQIKRYGLHYYVSSPYNSDTYSSIRSLLIELIKLRFINDKTTVMDITAGRGECAYALDEMSIKRISISRSDIYTSIRHHENIEYLIEYDLADDALPNVLMSKLADFDKYTTVILIDISHLGKKKGKFLDRLLDLMSLSYCLIVRFNAIKDLWESFCQSDVMKDYEISLSITSSGACQSPISYLIMKPKCLKAFNLKALPEGNALLSHIIRDFRLLLKGVNADMYNDGPLACSIMEDLGLEYVDDDSIEALISLVCDLTRSKSIMFLKSNSQRMMWIPVDSHQVGYLIKHNMREKLILHQADLNALEYLVSIGVPVTNQDREVFNKKEFTAGKWYISAEEMDHETLVYLRRSHKHKLYRSIMNAIIIMDIQKDSRMGVTLIEAVDKLWAQGPKSLIINNKRSKNLLDAFLLLCSDVVANDSSYHLKLVENLSAVNMLDSNQISELLHYRKMLSGLYPRVKSVLSNWYNIDSFYPLLKVSIANKYLRPPLYKTDQKLISKIRYKEKDTEKIEMSSNDERLRNAFLESVDKMIDLEIFAGGIIHNNSLIVNKRDETLDLRKLELNESIFGVGPLKLDDIGWRIPDEVLDAELKTKEQLRNSIIRFEGETDKEFDERLNMMAMTSVLMMDDDFIEDD